MRIKLVMTAVAACMALAGCATPYQEPGFTGGVTARKEADGTWLILAAGNANTTVEATSDYTFVKAAETVKSQGFTCFDIVGQYAAMEDVSMGSQYGTMDFKKPDARLRIRIREDLKTCDDKVNADAIIARLSAKVRNPKSYLRKD